MNIFEKWRESVGCWLLRSKPRPNSCLSVLELVCNSMNLKLSTSYFVIVHVEVLIIPISKM